MTSWKRNFIVVWLSQFCSLSGFSLALPFSPYYIQMLGITEPNAVKLWSALSISATALSLCIFSPIWGMLSDRYGRKLMMLRANFGGVIVLALMAFAPNALVFVILRFCQGIFTGTINAAQTFVATSTPHDKQGVALGSLSAAVFSGTMVGPVVGGFLADEIGYRAVFLVSSALLLTAGLLILFQLKENFVPPQLGPHKRTVPWRERVTALGPGAPILVLFLFMSVARTFDRPIMPLYIQQIHGSLQGASRWTGALNGIAAVGAMLAGVILGRLADKISPPIIGKLSAVGAGLFMIVIGLFPNFYVIFPAIFMMVFCGGGLDPVFSVWLSKVTPASRRGTIFGWGVTAKSLGWGIAPMVSAGVAVRFGIPVVFFIGSLLFLQLVPLIHIVSKKVLAAQNTVNHSIQIPHQERNGFATYASLRSR